MQATFTALRAIFYASGFILVWWWAAMQMRTLDVRLGISIAPWLAPIGIGIAALGAVLTLSCIGVFIRFGRGTPAPFDPPREFVAVGPYRFVRNPMYVGGFLIIFGGGLAIQSFSIVVLAFVFVAVMHAFVIIYEESALERRFGSNYTAYKSRVPRWLPRLGKPERTA